MYGVNFKEVIRGNKVVVFENYYGFVKLLSIDKVVIELFQLVLSSTITRE